MLFCFYVIFLLRDQWIIARLSAAMGTDLVGNNFWPIPWELHGQFHGNSFPNEKNICRHGRYLQSIKTFLIVELSQYRKSGSTFSSSEPVAASGDCSRPENALFLCSPPKLCRSAAPRAWPLMLQSNPSIVFSNSLREWLPNDRHWSAGARTWTQTWTLQPGPDQWVVVVLSATKPPKKVQ